MHTSMSPGTLRQSIGLLLVIVSLGGGVGKIFHLGRLPVNTQLSAYYNVVHPDSGPTWQIRFQVQLVFPK
jgi:hypothetical protein